MKKIYFKFLLLILAVITMTGTGSAQVYPDVYYRFNASGIGDDTLVTDVFGNFDAVRQINYTWEPDGGKYQGALRFNGNTEVDLAPELVDHVFNMGYREKTVAMWIKADDPSANGMIYYDGPGNSNMGIRLLEGNLEGVVTAGDNPASPKIELVSTPFTSTDWSHVALVFDHGAVELYLNGNMAASGTLNTDTVIGLQQKPARLGYKTSGWSPFRQEGIGANEVYNFNGLIDEFMLFTEALDASNIQNIMEGDTATVKPAPATGLTANAISHNTIDLSWQDNSNNELGFRILASREGGNYLLVGEVPADATSYSHAGLYPDSTYSYQVLAFNFIGIAEPSNTASATTLPPPPPPAAPDGLTASVIDFRTIELSWNDNAVNEEEYRILGSKNGEPFTTIAVLPPETVSFTDSLLDPSTSYRYRIFAWNGGGSSDTTGIVQAETPVQPSVEGIGFPYDAGVINVKDHGVYGDGVHDDTEALQELLNKYTGTFYFPNGTYLISNTITWVDPARNITFQGQSKENVIIKLKDNCEGFQNTVLTKAMIWTGEAPAQRFRNYIHDMTFNTGTGNPGAIGLQFIANNAGGIFNVDIISGDGQGMIGLDLGYTNEQGPCLIKNVTVDGFAVGISTKHTVDSVVFEHITLRNQTQVAFRNSDQCLSIRKMVSENDVPAFINQGAVGVVTLIDCSFKGGGADQYAIENNGYLMVRNLTTEGYQNAIENKVGTQENEEGPVVEEYVSHPVLTLFPTEEKSLGLPIKETPEVPLENDFSQWISVVKCGAIPGDDLDDTEAIQAAIDSGKSTVYFPKGSYNIDGTVEVRGNVSRIIGFESNVTVPMKAEPAFKVVDGTAETVVFERFSHFGYNFHYTLDNASDRTLVIKNCSALSGKMTGTGDVFIEDVVSNIASQFIFNNQNVWARQLNIESRNGVTHLLNNGGNVWILGYKTENKGIQIHNRDGGSLEMLGGFFYSVGTDYDDPMIINDNSNISITVGESHYGTTPFDSIVREMQSGETRVLMAENAPDRGAATVLPLYVGRGAVEETLQQPTDLAANAVSSSAIEISWIDNATEETSYRVERKTEGGNFKQVAIIDPDSQSYLDEGLNGGSVYIYRVKAIGESSNSPYSNEASAQTFTVSTEESLINGINVYPNPATDILFAAFNDQVRIKEIVVYDSFGKTMLRKVPDSMREKTEIPLNSFDPGIYAVKIISDKGTMVKMFIKL